MYSDEFDKWSKLGAVQVKSVFSRQSNDKKKYVQDLIWEDQNEIVNLYRNGAWFYTCGNGRKLDASVKTCFTKIIAQIKECDEEEAAKIFVDRYSFDVFAWDYIHLSTLERWEWVKNKILRKIKISFHFTLSTINKFCLGTARMMKSNYNDCNICLLKCISIRWIFESQYYK